MSNRAEYMAMVEPMGSLIRSTAHTVLDNFIGALATYGINVDYTEVAKHKLNETYYRIDNDSLDLLFNNGWVIAKNSNLRYNYIADLKVVVTWSKDHSNYPDGVIYASFASPRNVTIDSMQQWVHGAAEGAHGGYHNISHVRTGYMRSKWRNTQYYNSVEDFAAAYKVHLAGIVLGESKRIAREKKLMADVNIANASLPKHFLETLNVMREH